MTFVAEGRVELHSPIRRWLPEVAASRVLRHPGAHLDDSVPADRPVTIEDLLTLRGGLGFTSDFGSPLVDALVETMQEGPSPRTLDRETFLSAAGAVPLAHQPGRGWTYNTGSTILGLLLERVAEKPLDHLMSDRIFGPLHMHDAQWWVPEGLQPRFTSRYRTTGNLEQPLELIDPPSGAHAHPPSFPDGASGLIGTADDWLKFGTMLIGHGTFEGRELLPQHWRRP
ncbi:MAG: serine hydrolase [Microbacterium enclense]